jgi:ParB family chromosome partitioning protein
VDDAVSITHVRSGAVGAMGRSLGQIAQAAEQAKALIASGATVIEIPPEQLHASFIKDRLSTGGPEFELLVEAIKESGQRSPILVRPSPDHADRYQIVFGHRRVMAAERLGRAVRAVVQNLTDEEVAVIQGQENSARTDLTYIERGLFAATLEESGFDRRVIMAALKIEKTQLSKLLALVHAISRETIIAIGPAPKAGRPRWAALAERLKEVTQKRVMLILDDADFQSADSDARFVRLFTELGPKSGGRKPRSSLLKIDGRKVATIERVGTKVAVTIDENDAPAFGEFLAAQLPDLHREFQRRKEAGTITP